MARDPALPNDRAPEPTAALDDGFEAKKRASFLQVLFKVARLANEKGIARARAATGEGRLRLAHTTLFPHIPFDGIRLTHLAERVGVTKQAVAQLIDELEEMGVIERVPDPSDGRAKMIRFSARGREGLLLGLGVLGELERELAAVVGEERLADTHATLLALLDALEGRERR